MSIKDKINDLFKHKPTHIYISNKEIDIELQDTVITYDLLDRLSVLLNTKKINIGDYRSTDGCESCDWGSTTTVTISCQDCTIGK